MQLLRALGDINSVILIATMSLKIRLIASKVRYCPTSRVDRKTVGKMAILLVTKDPLSLKL